MINNIKFISAVLIILFSLNYSFSFGKEEPRNIYRYSASADSKFDVNLPTASKPFLKRLSLNNSGIRNINNFRVSINNSPDLSGLPAIINLLKLSDKTEIEKIVTISGFLKEYLKINNKAQIIPNEEIDPVKIINIYGDVSPLVFAQTFSQLCQASNIKYRIRNLKGVPAAEIFYDNKWHYYDIFENNYLTDKSGNILSVLDIYELSTSETLVQERGIKDSAKKSPLKIIDFISTNISSNFYNIPNSKGYNCQLNLNKNEEIIFKADYEKFRVVNNEGFYIISPDISSKSIYEKLVNYENIENTENDKVKSPRLHLKKDSKNGKTDIQIKFPFIIQKASIELDTKIKSGGSIKVYASKDGVLWDIISELTEETSKNQKIILPENFSRIYSYFLRFEFSQKKDFTVGLENLKIENIFKYNPLIHPKIKNQTNTVEIFFENKYSTGNNLDLEMEYSLN